MEKLSLLRVSSLVIDFFSVPAAYYETASLQLTKMMRHGRACHINHGSQVDNTFFVVTENPEYTNAAPVTKLLENICDNLKFFFLWDPFRRQFRQLTVIVRKNGI